MDLTAGQLAVVEHSRGPCRVTGGFGSGVSTALAARARRLVTEGRRPVLVSMARGGMTRFAVELLARHGRPVSLLWGAEQEAMVASLLDGSLVERAADIAAAIVAFQASFLGDEELRTHAEAAGCGAEAEELIAVTSKYLELLAARDRVDAGGALVAASLLLRHPPALAAEQERFDELLVDDFQLATFGTNRLLSQLVGHAGEAVVVGGNAEAAVSTAALASSRHLERFDRRFGAALDVRLGECHRSPGVPALRIVDDGDAVRVAAAEAIGAAKGMGIDREATAVVTRALAETAVGREWPLVVVPDATEGRWPSERPGARAGPWFDHEVFHGPDVPDEHERDRRWMTLERRRFAVACSRATRLLVVIAEVNVTRFVRDLL
ncbi:MAG TPA: UvrD-helicase domain-containing protein [Acidimicrobiales bacterium]|nr:UvrD-helicase domain-containing protein [Acidimicrobiales bacterium]